VLLPATTATGSLILFDRILRFGPKPTISTNMFQNYRQISTEYLKHLKHFQFKFGKLFDECCKIMKQPAQNVLM